MNSNEHDRYERQRALANVGFAGFSDGTATIQSKSAWRLDLEKHEHWGLWSCRYYFVAKGLLVYRLGFGTTDKTGMFPVFDRIAQSFAMLTEAPTSPWSRN